jgi:hypothetical protein
MMRSSEFLHSRFAQLRALKFQAELFGICEPIARKLVCLHTTQNRHAINCGNQDVETGGGCVHVARDLGTYASGV